MVPAHILNIISIMNFFFLFGLVAAQQQGNALSVEHPGWGELLNAGSTFEITWKEAGSVKEVDLILLGGDSQNFTKLYTIASGIEDTGHYRWNIPSDQSSNSAFSILIQDSNDHSTSNYSPYFTILAEGQGYTSSSNQSETVTSRATVPRSTGTISSSLTSMTAVNVTNRTTSSVASHSQRATSSDASGKATTSATSGKTGLASNGANILQVAIAPLCAFAALFLL